jgi:hypothetical protein
MLVACRLAGLYALVFDYAVGGAGAQPGGWGLQSLPDWCATLGPLWVSILAGSPLEAPDGLKAYIAPIPPPE